MRAQRILLLGFCFCTGLEASATLGPPIKVRILPQSSESIWIELEAGARVHLSDRWIDGSAWSFQQAAKGETTLDAGDKTVWETVGSAAGGDFVLHFTVDGRAVSVRVDPQSLDRLGVARELVERAPSSERPSGGVTMRSPEPVSIVGVGDEIGDDEGIANKAPRNIRVHGRFVYERQDPGGGTTTLGADGLTVRVYDQDLTIRQLLATTITDAYGYFDETFYWNQCCEADPDIVVEFEAENSAVEVEEPVLEYNYLWATGEWHNFAGTDLDLGVRSPLYESDHPALHILSTVTRGWRWLYVNEGYDTPATDVQWPANWSGSFYSQLWNELHITGPDQWLEWVILHEYGHHWTQMYSALPIAYYCNGFCDSAPPIECGHCQWCQESAGIAWGEGFADWIGDFLPKTFAADYGVGASYVIGAETIGQCGEDSQYHLPNSTEGFLQAVLNDIMDANQDDDPYEPMAMDELAMGTNEIFDIAELHDPTEPMEFLEAFLNQYSGVTSQLWATAKNNGYDLDFAGPGQVTNLYSTTHPLGVPDGDPTPQFLWDIPPDNVSGVDGFSVLISTSPANQPDLIADIGVQNYYDAGPLSPGTYYFSIRAVDRAGNWSAFVTSYGPFLVDQPEPADLSFVLAGGWDYRVTPRATPDASAGDVHVSPTLPTSGTYWNVAYTNTGDLTTSSGFAIGAAIDGNVVTSVNVPAVGSFQLDYLYNAGPFNVVGGRHSFAGILDVDDVIAETFENNNVFGHQFSWEPALLVEADLPVPMMAPPQKDGGWSMITDGSTPYDNCHGFRAFPTVDWHAFVVDPDSTAEDFDVRLYPYVAGTDGFTVPLHSSSRAAGRTDAVVVNRNVDPSGYEDVGVVNESGGGHGYRVDWVQSSAIALGTKQIVNFSKNLMLALRHVDIAAPDVGGLTISAKALQGKDFTLFWFDQSVASAALADGASASSNLKGQALLEPYASLPGSYALAIVVDPSQRNAASQVEFSVTRQLPNLLPTTPGGWFASLVPLGSATGTIFNVPAPGSLPGNANSTYLNVAVGNSSPSPAGAFTIDAKVDARLMRSIPRPGVGGSSTSFVNNSGPILVHGGRHTLSMVLDSLEEVDETDESDNVHGAQWVWSPLDLAENSSTTRARPADRTAGWEDAIGAAALWYNCDGLFMDDYGQIFQGVAVLPDAGSNVDIRLHEHSSDALSGFDLSLTASAWGPDASDFVVVRQAASPRGFDVGIIAEGVPQGGYTAHAVSSIGLGLNPLGKHGPYLMDAGQILQLFAVEMDPGHWGFEVVQEPGDPADWGISIHPADKEFFAKSTVLANGAAWFEPSGVDEFISPDLAVHDIYCVAVWKVGTADLAASAKFSLRVLDLNATDSEEAAPTHFAFRGNAPNPFNPATTLFFELPEAGFVDLILYDAAGRSVRKLLRREFLEAGRHRTRWDGRDERGRAVASGVYFAHLRHGAAEAVRKLTLTK